MAKQEVEQLSFGELNLDTDCKKEWQDMPEFNQEDNMPFKTLYVHFKNREDMKKFIELVDQKITIDTQSIWYPKAVIGGYYNKRYADESK